MYDERETNEWPMGMTGRGLRGRRMARFMFVPAIVPAFLTAALFMATPNTMGGGMYPAEPDPLGAIVVGAAILAYVVGLAAMIRIYRADPEAHKSFWRSRRY